MNFAGVPARAAAAVVIGGWSISPSRRGGRQNPSYFSLTTTCHASADPKPIQPPSAHIRRFAESSEEARRQFHRRLTGDAPVADQERARSGVQEGPCQAREAIRERPSIRGCGVAGG
jgi:hypothetical protein